MAKPSRRAPPTGRKSVKTIKLKSRRPSSAIRRSSKSQKFGRQSPRGPMQTGGGTVSAKTSIVRKDSSRKSRSSSKRPTVTQAIATPITGQPITRMDVIAQAASRSSKLPQTRQQILQLRQAQISKAPPKTKLGKAKQAAKTTAFLLKQKGLAPKVRIAGLPKIKFTESAKKQAARDLEDWAEDIVERGAKLDKAEIKTFQDIDDKYLQARYAIDEFFPAGTKKVSKVGANIFKFGEQFLQGSIASGKRFAQAGEKGLFLAGALEANIRSGDKKNTENFFKELVSKDQTDKLKEIYTDPNTYKQAAIGAAVATVLGASRTKAKSVKKIPRSGTKAAKQLKTGTVIKDPKGNLGIVRKGGKVVKVPKSVKQRLFDRKFIAKKRQELNRIFKKRATKLKKLQVKKGLTKKQLGKQQKALLKEEIAKGKLEVVKQAKARGVSKKGAEALGSKASKIARAEAKFQKNPTVKNFRDAVKLKKSFRAQTKKLFGKADKAKIDAIVNKEVSKIDNLILGKAKARATRLKAKKLTEQRTKGLPKFKKRAKRAVKTRKVKARQAKRGLTKSELAKQQSKQVTKEIQKGRKQVVKEARKQGLSKTESELIGGKASNVARAEARFRKTPTKKNFSKLNKAKDSYQKSLQKSLGRKRQADIKKIVDKEVAKIDKLILKDQAKPKIRPKTKAKPRAKPKPKTKAKPRARQKPVKARPKKKTARTRPTKKQSAKEIKTGKQKLVAKKKTVKAKTKDLTKAQIKTIAKSVVAKTPAIGIAALKGRLAFKPTKGAVPSNKSIREVKKEIDKQRKENQKQDQKRKDQQKKADDIKKAEESIKDIVRDVVRTNVTGSASKKSSIQKQVVSKILRSKAKSVTKTEVKKLIKVPIKLKKKPKKQKGKTQGYNVLVKEKARIVKRKGKTKRIPSKRLKINKRSLPKGRAERLFKKVVDNTSAQTGRIKKSGTLVKKPKKVVKTSFRKFRASKTIKGARTEKRKHAIDTRGEKRGITVKGWIARKEKARKARLKKKKPLKKKTRRKKNGKK